LNKIFVSLVLGIIISWSCLEGDPLHDVTGARLPNGTVVRDTLYAVNNRSVIEGKVSTAFSTRLLLGTYKNFETRALIQFGPIPHDSIHVDSLRLVLTAVDNQGDNFGTIQGSAHMVNEYWPETVNEDEDWNWQNNISYDPAYVSQFEVGEEVSDYQIIDLPSEIMTVWQDTVGGSKNFGLLLDYQSADYIKQYSSVDGLFNSQRPRLVYVWYEEAQDSTHHDTLYVSQDASLIDYTGTFDPEKIYVASGYSVRSFFEFDLSQIPATAVFSTMNFVAVRDSVNSLKNNEGIESMILRTATTPFEELPSYTIDSTFTTNVYYSIYVVESTDNQLSILTSARGTGSQYFLQSILNGEVEYGSFMLQYTNEGERVSVYTLFDNQNADIENRPKLIFEYLEIPHTRM
jgi:hypothetical protein